MSEDPNPDTAWAQCFDAIEARDLAPGPRDEAVARLIAIRITAEARLGARVALAWLTGYTEALGARPLDLLRLGRFDEVEASLDTARAKAWTSEQFVGYIDE